MFSSPEFLRECGYFCSLTSLHKVYQPICTTEPLSTISATNPVILKNEFFLKNVRDGLRVVIKEGAYF